MKLAIITCQQLPEGVPDDAALWQALEQHGFNISQHIWNQPADWSGFDACLLRTVWDYHDHPKAFDQWLDTVSQHTRLINAPEVVRWNLNKRYLRELRDFGITLPPSLWLDNTAAERQWLEWLAEYPATHYFLKPLVGADSAGTLKFSADQTGLQTASQHLQQWLPKGGMMLQPFIDRVESFGETSAIYFAGNLSHAVRKIPRSGDYRVQDTFGASDISYQLSPAEMALCKACIEFLSDRFSALPYARFDFLHDAQGDVYLNEAELIEPSLFFKHGGEQAANAMACAIRDYLLPTEASDPAAT
jgi:hypothetical protein